MATSSTGQGNGIAGYDQFSGKGNPKGYFLWWCSGVHRPTLEKFPTEQVKYNTLGGILLATFLLAALSSGYAFYTLFNDIFWASGFAVLWGMIIFNFDRFMVSTIRKYGTSRGTQIRLAIPRIVLAVLIGFTIARPLELKLFEKEINTRVESNLAHKIQAYNLQQDSISKALLYQVTADRDRLLKRKKAMEDTLFALQHAYIREADGTGGSGKRGIEAITQLKQDAYLETKRGFESEFGSIAAGIAVKDKLMGEEEAQLLKRKADFAETVHRNIGFLERNKGLQSLSDEEHSVWYANLFISLLIILLETAPILAKLLLPAGPYDIAIASQELVPMTEMETALRNRQEEARKGNLSAV